MNRDLPADWFESFERRVIYDDNRLLVVNKPAGLATMGLPEGETTLFNLAQRYIKVKYQKPGAVYLGVVSRLDLPVSGLVVFARNSKAANRLNEQIRNRSIKKIYQALVEGELTPSNAECLDMICEDKRNQSLWIPKATVTSEYLKRFNAKEARLKYRRLKKYVHTTLVEIELETGRKHQIRLQMSSRGAPIVGDGKYGAKRIDETGICLCATRLVLVHPTTNQEMEFNVSRPDWWQHFT